MPPVPGKGGNWFAKLPTAGKAGVIVGGLGAALLIYKHFKSASATSTPVSTAAGCPSGYSSDGAGGCVPTSSGAGAQGGGYGGGSGGGGGDSGIGAQILTALQALTSANAAGAGSGSATQPLNNPATPGDGTGSQPTTSAATGTAPISATPISAPTTGPTASGGYPLSAQPSAPTAFPFTTIFTGTGGTTYYGVGNQAALAKAKAAGYKIADAKSIGVPGGTTKAQYAYR
jgi:hypothetical protein